MDRTFYIAEWKRFKDDYMERFGSMKESTVAFLFAEYMKVRGDAKYRWKER